MLGEYLSQGYSEPSGKGLSLELEVGAWPNYVTMGQSCPFRASVSLLHNRFRCEVLGALWGSPATPFSEVRPPSSHCLRLGPLTWSGGSSFRGWAHVGHGCKREGGPYQAHGTLTSPVLWGGRGG